MQLRMRICFALLLTALLAAWASAVGPAAQQRAWDILDAGVREKAFAKRSQAIQVLGLLPGDGKAVGMAERALADPAPEVRVAAATALGQMESSSSVPKLERLLNDKEISVVLAAAHSLRILHDKAAFEIYYEILVGERKSGSGLIADQEKFLRDRKKLAQLGFEEGIGFVPFASMGWEVVKAVHKDDVSPVRAAAAKVLAEDPDPRSGQALVRSCFDKSWVVRVAALDAIARRGDRALLNGIQPVLSDEKDPVRYTAAAAVIRLSRAPRKAVHPTGKPPSTRVRGKHRGRDH
jgi:HEAT repeat protein